MKNRVVIKVLVWLPMLLLLSLITGNVQGEEADEIQTLGHSEVEVLFELGLLDQVEEEDLERLVSREVGVLMILKLLGYNQLDVDLYSRSDIFSDVGPNSQGWVALAYEKGIVKGVTGAKFEPERSMTLREYLTFLLRAIGRQGDEVYDQCFTIAEELGLYRSQADSNVFPETVLTKREAAILMYKALFVQEQMESVSLLNLLIEKGVFENSKAVELGLKEDRQEILKINKKSRREFELVFSKSFSTDNYEVFLQTPVSLIGTIVTWNDTYDRLRFVVANDLSEGEYGVVLRDKNTRNKVLSGQLLIPEVQYQLDIVSDELIFQKKAPLQFVLYDQYGKISEILSSDIRVSVYNSSSNISHTILKDEVVANHILLRDIIEEGARVGDFLKVTIEYEDLSVSKTVKVGRMVSGRRFELQYICDVDGNKPVYIDQKEIVMEYSYRTNKGGTLRLSSHTADQDQLEDKEVVGNITFRSDHPEIVDVDTIQIDADGRLTFETGDRHGVVTISATNSMTHFVETIEVFVFPKAILSRIDTVGMEQVIAAEEVVEMSIVGYDQFGASYSIQDQEEIRFQVVTEGVLEEDSLNVHGTFLSYKTQNQGETTIKMFNKNGILIGNLDVEVLEKARPIEITDCLIPRLYEASEGVIRSLKREDIQFIDQYGRKHSLDGKEDIIYLERADQTESDNESQLGMIELGILDQDGLVIRADSELLREEYRLVFAEYPEVAYNFEIASIPSEQIVTYHLPDIDDLTIGEGNARTLQLLGFNEEGFQVELSSSKITRIKVLDEKIIDVSTDGVLISISGISPGLCYVEVYEEEKMLVRIRVAVTMPLGEDR